MNFQAISTHNTKLSSQPLTIGNSSVQRLQKQAFIPQFKKSTANQVSINSSNQPFRKHTLQASLQNHNSYQYPSTFLKQNAIQTVPSVENISQSFNVNPASQAPSLKLPSQNLGFLTRAHSTLQQNTSQKLTFQGPVYKCNNRFMQRAETGQRGDKQIVRATGTGYGSDMTQRNEKVPDFKIQYIQDSLGLSEVKFNFNEYEWEEKTGITHITKEGKSNLMRQFAIECLLFNMPLEFVKKMKNSAKFREKAIETIIKFYNCSFDYNLNQTFSTAFDLNLNKVYFYSTFKLNHEKLRLTNQEILECSDLSVFDQFWLQKDTVAQTKNIYLNQDEEYVENNIIINNGESHMNESSSCIKHFKEEGEEKLFVPKDKVYKFIGDIIRKNQFFYMDLKTTGDQVQDVNENIKLYYSDLITNDSMICRFSTKTKKAEKRGEKQVVRATGPGYGSDTHTEDKNYNFPRNRDELLIEDMERQFAIECLLCNMPLEFVNNMKISSTYRDYFIEKLEHLISSELSDEHLFEPKDKVFEDLRQIMKNDENFSALLETDGNEVPDVEANIKLYYQGLIPNNSLIMKAGKRGDQQVVRATGPGYGSDSFVAADAEVPTFAAQSMSDALEGTGVEPWQLWFGLWIGLSPFVIAAYEFGKRILIQRQCELCSGSGLIQKGRYARKCTSCGGFLPWQSWGQFFTSEAGNGGVVRVPKGQTSVFYDVEAARLEGQRQAKAAREAEEAGEADIEVPDTNSGQPQFQLDTVCE